MIKIAIVEDQDLARDGLVAILSVAPDLEVVGALPDARGAADLAAREQVDVMLMDIALPGIDGIEATKQVLRRAPQTSVVMLTTLPDDEHVEKALQAGARGYLLKTSSAGDLVAAVRQAHHGRRPFAPEVLDRLSESFAASGPRHDPDAIPPALKSLTEREQSVFREVGRGLSNAEIAQKLFLSESTVKTYVARILRKLGLTSRVKAVVLAFETGFVTGTDAEHPDLAGSRVNVSES